MTGPDSAAHRGDRALIVAGYLLVVLSLAQVAEFVDSSGFLLSSQRGINTDLRHVMFTPLLIGWTRALTPLGLSHLDAARGLAVVCCALAVAMSHATARACGLRRGAAAFAALGVACSPAVLFAGTVVNPYAAAFAAASVGLFCAARGVWCAPRPASLRWLFVAGFCTGCAGTLHATANALPILLVPLVIALRRLAVSSGDSQRSASGWRRHAVLSVAVPAVAVLVGHLSVGFGYALIAKVSGLPVGSGMSFEVLFGWFVRAGGSLGLIPYTVYEEWLYGYAPLAIAPLVGVFMPRLRVVSLVLCAVLVAELAVCHVLLQGGLNRGVYILPLSIPVALLAASVLPRRLLSPLLVAGLVLGVVSICKHDRREHVERYVSGLRAEVASTERATAVDAYLIVGVGLDMEARFAELPDQEILFINDLIRHPKADVAAALPQFDALVASQIAAGRQVFLTADGRAWLEKMRTFPGGVHNAGPLFHAHLEERYRLEPVRVQGFVAERLAPR